MRYILPISILALILTFAGYIANRTPHTDIQQQTQTLVVAPNITVTDQHINNSKVILGPILMTVDGWLVLYTNVGEKPGKILGYTHVSQGEHSDIFISISEKEYTGKIHVAPHYDWGEKKQFEFPGIDMPIEVDGLVPVESFIIE
jgi:hypothetical protein